MGERHADRSATTHCEHLELALDQLVEDARVYDLAVDSFNTHLENHLERRDLHDLPTRRPITRHEAYDGAITGERDAMESVLKHLLEESVLDSAVRRHPRIYPIHLEAVKQLAIARNQLITTLESSLRHLSAER